MVGDDADDGAPRAEQLAVVADGAEAPADRALVAESASAAKAGVDDRDRKRRVAVVEREVAALEEPHAERGEIAVADLLEVRVRPVARRLVDCGPRSRCGLMPENDMRNRLVSAAPGELGVGAQFAQQAVKEELAGLGRRVVALHQRHARR